MRMSTGAARSILSASICLTVELRTVPILTAAFGAYTMLEQPLRPATTRVKRQAFAKAHGIRLKREVLAAVSSERVNGASRGAGMWSIWVRAGRLPVWRHGGRWPGWVRAGRRPGWVRAGRPGWVRAGSLSV